LLTGGGLGCGESYALSMLGMPRAWAGGVMTMVGCDLRFFGAGASYAGAGGANFVGASKRGARFPGTVTVRY
jgi:hypothetical protein